MAEMRIAPEGYAAVGVHLTFIAAVICLPMSITLAVILNSSLPLLLLMGPPGLFLTYLFYPSLRISTRKESIETELAFLSSYLAMAASAGVPIYVALKRLVSEPNPLPASTRESLTILRDTEIFEKDSMISMERMSMKHPSKTFRAWLGGFLHVLRMGGDLVAHLDGAAERSLEELENMWTRYRGRAGSLAVFVTVFYALIPITLYVFLLVVVSAATIAIALVFNFLVAPVGAVILGFAMEMGRPKPPVSYAKYYKLFALGLPAGTFVGVILSASGIPSHVALGLAVIAACTPTAVKFEVDSLRETSIEAALPRFIDDIAENRRVGQSLERAIASVSWQKRYGRFLGRIVDTIAWNIEQFKQDVSQAVGLVKVDSWHSRCLLWLLEEAARTGGGTLAIFERLTKFADRYTSIQSAIKADLRAYQVLFYFVSSIIVVTTIFIMNYVLNPSTGIVGAMVTGGFLSSFVPSKENVQFMANLVLQGAVIMSALLGFLGGKMGRGTFAGGTMHAIIAVTSAVVALLIMMNIPILGGVAPPTQP
jgi:pilus assembly protein TadC